jgi:menaquinone-dependent protoporphyrinogen oxidase
MRILVTAASKHGATFEIAHALGDVTDLMASTGAREHRLFCGKLDRQHLNFAERALVAALRAPYGDYRDFAEIRDWATGIAATLLAAQDLPT